MYTIAEVQRRRDIKNRVLEFRNPPPMRVYREEKAKPSTSLPGPGPKPARSLNTEDVKTMPIMTKVFYFLVLVSAFMMLTAFSSAGQTPQQAVITADTGQLHHVYGQIFAGEFPLTTGFAILISVDTVSPFNPYVSTCQTDSNGVYYFTMIPSGDYYIYAVPAGQSGYLPTYYGESLSWKTAKEVQLGQPADPFNIRLLPSDALHVGEGSIHGVVSLEGLKPLLLDRIMMLLYNAGGQAIGYSDVDEAGNFAFSGLAYGSYYLKAEMAGVTSDMIPVVLSTGRPDATIPMTFTGTSIFGIENRAEVPESIVVYPNPVTDWVNVTVSSSASTAVGIDLTDSNGKKICRVDGYLRAGSNVFSLPVAQQAAGFYFLHVTTGNGTATWCKVIKY
jgi:hypothetical protein